MITFFLFYIMSEYGSVFNGVSFIFNYFEHFSYDRKNRLVLACVRVACQYQAWTG